MNQKDKLALLLDRYAGKAESIGYAMSHEDPETIEAERGQLRSIGDEILGCASRLTADTPLGTLVAYESADPDHPGICIDLERGEEKLGAPLVLTEFRGAGGQIATHVWYDCGAEDYTHTGRHVNIDGYFDAFEEDEGAKPSDEDAEPDAEAGALQPDGYSVEWERLGLCPYCGSRLEKGYGTNGEYYEACTECDFFTE